MVMDFCYVGKWRLGVGKLTDKETTRCLKSLQKETFNQIGIKIQIGWDTVDELLCKFYNWKIVTDKDLHVKTFKTNRR